MANPRGQQRDKPYRDALRRAISRAEQNKNDPHALDRIAEKHLAQAAGGDMQAIKELADRLDGKPAQAHIGGEDDDPPVKHIHEIRRTIVDPRHQDGAGVSTAAETGPV